MSSIRIGCSTKTVHSRCVITDKCPVVGVWEECEPAPAVLMRVERSSHSSVEVRRGSCWCALAVCTARHASHSCHTHLSLTHNDTLRLHIRCLLCTTNTHVHMFGGVGDHCHRSPCVTGSHAVSSCTAWGVIPTFQHCTISASTCLSLSIGQTVIGQTVIGRFVHKWSDSDFRLVEGWGYGQPSGYADSGWNRFVVC